MSLDRLQSKSGLLTLVPESAYGTTGTGSTIASLQYPGGIGFGDIAGIAPALATSLGQGGGAFWMKPVPTATTTGSFGQACVTGQTMSHFNAGFIGINQTITVNNAQLQPPSYPGQLLFLHNCGTKSFSCDTIGTVSNWTNCSVSSATVTAQVAVAAFTLNSGSIAGFIASPFDVTTTAQWPVGLWRKIL